MVSAFISIEYECSFRCLIGPLLESERPNIRAHRYRGCRRPMSKIDLDLMDLRTKRARKVFNKCGGAGQRTKLFLELEQEQQSKISDIAVLLTQPN